MFGGSQMFFGTDSMAIHVIVIGGPGALHLVNRFRYMLVDIVEIMPIAYLRRHQGAGNK